MIVRLARWSLLVGPLALAATGCTPPPPLPGGPPPEYEPPRAFEMPKSPDAAPEPSAAPATSAAPDAPGAGEPSTWTSTSVESPPPPSGTGDPIPADGRIGAKHLVVMFKDSRRAPSSITRTKEQARKRAEECLAKTRITGAKFEAVVRECTDEPYGKERGGDLATFKPEVMDPAFTKALLDLKVGQVSGLVETPFGYHLILRTQ